MPLPIQNQVAASSPSLETLGTYEPFFATHQTATAETFPLKEHSMKEKL